ncbi:MAG: hypothetical protein CL788_01675 [Chloroflexi bacterium]|nr:hypothetical protein [Chloroflexota bacterium]|tara:strand:+ start:755 stop:1126 length:372 start_codon:yes stop_codon:yes gene_type:complete
MAVFLSVLLGLFCIGVVVYPFFKNRYFPNISDALIGSTDSTSELDNIFRSIRTLQLEYRMGNISEEAFNTELDQYRNDAATCIQQMETERSSELETGVEHEIALARLRLQHSDDKLVGETESF